MKTIIFKKTTIRFRKWSRKAYAVFASLGKAITIGKLKAGVAVKSLNNGIESLSQVFSLFFLLVAGGATVSAVELTDSTEILLDELQVSAVHEIQFPGTGRYLQSFSSKDIKIAPSSGLDGFLKSVSGVDIRQRGVGGTQSDISIRGGSFDQVLVLLNGVDITDRQTGHHNLNIPIDLSDISDIEVLQGSAARKYGSQAFSGAINIVTNPSTKNKIDALFTAGSFNTFSQKISVGLNKSNISHFSSISHNSSKGYRHNTDFDTYNFFSHTNFNLENVGKLDFQLGYQNKSFGANGFYALAYPNQFEHTETFFTSISWKKTINRFLLSADVNYRKHYDRFELFRSFVDAAPWYADHNYHLTDVVGATFNADYFSKFGKISFGAISHYDHIFSTVLGENIEDVNKQPINRFERKSEKHFTKTSDRLVNTAYVDYSKSFGSIYVSAGGSMSYNQQFGAKYNWGADVSYLPVNNFIVHAALNSASRLPTFTDLYYQSETQTANPNLHPESSLTSELGLKYKLRNLQLNANGFYRKGSNIIDWIKYPDEVKWQSMNLVELNTLGYSISMGYTFNNSSVENLSLSYSFINSDKQAADYDSKYALDYLRHQLLFKFHHNVIKNTYITWNVALNDRAGEYTDFDTGVLKPYQPYLLAGARFAWEKYGFLVFTDVNNMLNSNYVDFGGLPLPGINVNVGVKWRLLGK